KNLQPDSPQTHAPAVAGVSETTGPGNATGFDATSDRRQLLYAQTRQGEILDAMAQPKTTEGSGTGPHRNAFHSHSHFQFLDESGRAVLPRLDRRCGSRRQFHQRRGISHRHDGISGRAQSPSEAIRMEEKR